jgi:hypothetical protein
LISSFASLSFYFITQFFFNIIITKITCQNFSDSDFIKFTYYSNIISLISPIITLSASSLILRFYDKEYVHCVKQFVNIFSLFSIISLSIYFYFSDLFILSLLSMVVFNINYFNFCRAYNKYYELLFYTLIIKIVPIVLLYYFLPKKYITLNNLVIFLSIINLCYYLRYIFYFKTQNSFNKENKIYKKLFSYCFKTTLISSISVFAVIVEQYFAKNILNDNESYIFFFLTRISIIINGLSTLILTIYPVLYFKNFDVNKYFVKKIKWLFIFLNSLYLAVFVILSPEIFSFLSYDRKITFGIITTFGMIEFIRVIASLNFTYFNHVLQLNYTIIASLIILIVKVICFIIYYDKLDLKLFLNIILFSYLGFLMLSLRGVYKEKLL